MGRIMHEMNTLVTFFVISGIYFAIFFVAEIIFMQDDKEGS